MHFPKLTLNKSGWWALAVPASLAGQPSVAIAQGDKAGLEGSYMLEVQSSGAKCPPIIRAPLVVGRVRGNSIAMRLADQSATASFYGGGLAFTARFPEFDMTGPVRASGEFQRYQGRILIDMNLRWPEGFDCTASLSGSKPEERTPPAAPAAKEATPVETPAPVPAPPPAAEAAPPPTQIGSSTIQPPSTSWVEAGIGDCAGGDLGSTQGAEPEPGMCGAAALTAICWDGKTHRNGNEGRPWCSYKRTPTVQCSGGGAPGIRYSCMTAARAVAGTTVEGEEQDEGKTGLWLTLLKVAVVGGAGWAAGMVLAALIRRRRREEV